MNNVPPCTSRSGPAEVSETLDRERRFDKLGSALSTLRIFLVLVVQCYLLAGFALIFVRPPSPSFYAAIIVLPVNTLLFAGCLVRFFSIRKKMLRARNMHGISLHFFKNTTWTIPAPLLKL